MSERTFKPFDDATAAGAVGTSSAAVAFNSQHNGSTCRIMNRGSEWIFIKFGGSDVVADSNDIPIAPNWGEVFAVPSGATHCAAIGEDTGNTLYITPGDGD